MVQNSTLKFTALYFVSEKRIVFEFISQHINNNPVLALIELSAKQYTYYEMYTQEQ